MSIRKLRDEAKAARESIPALQKEADAALADLRQYAKEAGEEAKVDALLEKMEARKEAQNALDAAKDFYYFS